MVFLSFPTGSKERGKYAPGGLTVTVHTGNDGQEIALVSTNNTKTREELQRLENNETPISGIHALDATLNGEPNAHLLPDRGTFKIKVM